jgi:hypothetical protein
MKVHITEALLDNPTSVNIKPGRGLMQPEIQLSLIHTGL